MNDKFVVAIGSSAGGLIAMKSFFDCTLPYHATYVLLRHVPIKHQSELHLLLGSHSKLRFVEATSATPIKEDMIYIPPAQMYMTIDRDILWLKQRSVVQSRFNTVIDVFFTSLAETLGHNCIGVILSGNGTDGVNGATAIKAAGGMVITQTPESCLYTSMPQHIINAGLADHILDPADMPAVIRQHIDNRLMAMRQMKS